MATLFACYALFFFLACGFALIFALMLLISMILGFPERFALQAAVAVPVAFTLMCVLWPWLFVSRGRKFHRSANGPISITEYYHEQASVSRARRLPLEDDAVVQPAVVYFGHDADIGATSHSSVPRFLELAMTARRWCLVFCFSLTKQMVCELWTTENERILGVYRPLTVEDKDTYGTSWLEVIVFILFVLISRFVTWRFLPCNCRHLSVSIR